MKIALNGQQLAATHSLPEILDVFEAHGVKAIELWPTNFTGSSSTPEEFERFETKDVDVAGQLLRARGFEVACVTLGFHAAPLCIARGGTQRLTEALQGAVDTAVKLEARLASVLVSQGVDSVILCGATTSGCIRATAIDLLQYRSEEHTSELQSQ